MKILLPAILICLLGFASANHDVASAFEAAEIKPDILDDVPTELIKIKYGDKSVELGNELTPTEVKDIPEVHYEYEEGALYTLIMTDADLSREGENREANHWCVGNIPEDNISEGEVLSEYVGSGPVKGTGFHRYVFLLFKQNHGAITFNETYLSSTDGPGRLNFSSQKLTQKYNLGDPVAGNFYKAQWDEYSLVIASQLGL